MGIIKVDGTTKRVYTTKDGLLSNHINDLYIDNYDVVWVGTQKGLNVGIDSVFYTIDKNLGQQSSFITKVTEHNNSIYATGNNGLFKIDNSYPFTPWLNTELIIEQEDAQFSLNAVNYINSKSLKIAYQLDESSWVEGSTGSLDFKSIKKGEHTVTFKYKDNLSNWFYTKQYSFKIVLQWYKQVWVYVLIITMILGGIIVFTYYLLQKSIAKNNTLKSTIADREKLRNELNQVRENVAQDFHDELGNKLASISILSKLLFSESR